MRSAFSDSCTVSMFELSGRASEASTRAAAPARAGGVSSVTWPRPSRLEMGKPTWESIKLSFPKMWGVLWLLVFEPARAVPAQGRQPQQAPPGRG